MRSLLRPLSVLASLGLVAVAACVGDDPAGGNANSADSSADSAIQGDGGPGLTDASVDPLCTSVLSYWPGEGSLKDLNGQFDLQWKASSDRAPLPSTGFVNGKFGQALSLYDTYSLERQGYARLENLKELSISLWYKSEYSSIEFFAVDGVMRFGASGDKYQLTLNATADAGEKTLTFGGYGKEVDYTHVVLAISASEVRLYRNGVLQDTQTVGLPTMNSNQTIRFAAGVSGVPFSGSIDEITLFKAALTQADAERLGKGLRCDGALARPDVGPANACNPAPATQNIPCGAITCAGMTSVCCEKSGVYSCVASDLQCSGTVPFKCSKRTGCPGQACCAQGLAIETNQCASTASLRGSSCTSLCGSQETLCASDGECGPRKCVEIETSYMGGAGKIKIGVCR
jgi:hypothetical protein